MMKNILNITNGDCAVDVMKKAGLPGDFLPWRDVLHEGPVPKGMDLDELSQERAKFIASRGWGEANKILSDFVERDNVLKSFANYDHILLWFEHDLYDQLQLLQLLDWFNQNKTQKIQISLICVDQYLGPLSPEEMKELLKYQALVTKQQFSIASQAWKAFRESSPEDWVALLNIDTSELPFLHGTVIRLLEEYPNVKNGLSRTQQQALEVVASGIGHPWKIFDNSQRKEDRMFLGDLSFWEVLKEFIDSKPAILDVIEGNVNLSPIQKEHSLSITEAGKEILSNKKNWLEIREPDRWIGGVHLHPGQNWCWDTDNKTITNGC